jgi:hypothetical protein
MFGYSFGITVKFAAEKNLGISSYQLGLVFVTPVLYKLFQFLCSFIHQQNLEAFHTRTYCPDFAWSINCVTIVFFPTLSYLLIKQFSQQR